MPPVYSLTAGAVPCLVAGSQRPWEFTSRACLKGQRTPSRRSKRSWQKVSQIGQVSHVISSVHSEYFARGFAVYSVLIPNPHNRANFPRSLQSDPRARSASTRLHSRGRRASVLADYPAENTLLSASCSFRFGFFTHIRRPICWRASCHGRPLDVNLHSKASPIHAGRGRFAATVDRGWSGTVRDCY